MGARIFFWFAMAIWGGLEVRTSIVRGGSDTGEDAGSQRWSLGATLGGLLAVLVIDLAMPEILVAEEKHAPFLTAAVWSSSAGWRSACGPSERSDASSPIR